ncbi:helix-turn-helix domain-containing protein [Streptomyces cavernicola]|uniref:Helix-turn-helix transcriptional regulator n=1 Tax=Streptomyces cavernicola TaxID=3043613 RepID=A0ABT6SDC2_9ACTN|nr:helix-turn-helix transcriptional regulator [Streptomyces sp. B-S-A6]MDI3405814.1 helix-turn-helix transcriptional regulator [Streptomyces sp. B-S-A6]
MNSPQQKPGYEAVDALLASAVEPEPLPPAEQRRALRESLGLSRAQVATALGVGPSTVGGWENGRDPAGEVRGKYAYFLDAARSRLQETQAAQTRPCVLCGGPATDEVEGFPQHLDPQECARHTTPQDPVRPEPEPRSEPELQPEPEAEAGPEPQPKPQPKTKPAPQPQRRTIQRPTPVRKQLTGQAAPEAELIGRAVEKALAEHGGDVEAATAQLVRKAIPDAMALLDACRTGGRYDVIAHPWVPDILRKQSARGSDSIWEARPKWTRPELPPGAHEVTALDINGAYLSALKTHLPIGQLEHSSGFEHDRRRAGVHLITPPDWHHDPYLPNPLGNRDEAGPLWVTEPTLRLLLRLSGPKYGLCAPPEIHESFTSGATENLLEKFRAALRDARERAIEAEDETTVEYVKAMYSKFVSTMGESNYNRELYRPDWMHLIRSQAFANLWMKALRAHEQGLAVVRVMGTDELHVTGDWRRVFDEGRGVLEVKVKDVYTVGTDADAAEAELNEELPDA